MFCQVVQPMFYIPASVVVIYKSISFRLLSVLLTINTFPESLLFSSLPSLLSNIIGYFLTALLSRTQNLTPTRRTIIFFLSLCLSCWNVLVGLTDSFLFLFPLFPHPHVSDCRIYSRVCIFLYLFSSSESSLKSHSLKIKIKKKSTKKGYSVLRGHWRRGSFANENNLSDSYRLSIFIKPWFVEFTRQQSPVTIIANIESTQRVYCPL